MCNWQIKSTGKTREKIKSTFNAMRRKSQIRQMPDKNETRGGIEPALRTLYRIYFSLVKKESQAKKPKRRKHLFSGRKPPARFRLTRRVCCDKITPVCGYDGIGRRVGFRFLCPRRVGSSPTIRIKKRHPIRGAFLYIRGNQRKLAK